MTVEVCASKRSGARRVNRDEKQKHFSSLALTVSLRDPLRFHLIPSPPLEFN